MEPARAPEAGLLAGRMLELLRNYSSILCHSLCAEALLKEFLLLLREILGINRAAIGEIVSGVRHWAVGRSGGTFGIVVGHGAGRPSISHGPGVEEGER
jgi:hypothetical protein